MTGCCMLFMGSVGSQVSFFKKIKIHIIKLMLYRFVESYV